MKTKTNIRCIGDSHASFFSGNWEVQPCWPEVSADRLLGIKSFRLGAVTAYNLCNPQSSSGGFNLLMELLQTLDKCDGPLLLVFGEIDCRVHLLKQSRERQIPLDHVILDTVMRYVGVVTSLKNQGWNIAVWGPPASTVKLKISDKLYPTYGTCQERNQVTRIFNKHLEQECKKEGVPFLSIFKQLVDAQDETRMEYYLDDIHLAPLALRTAYRELQVAFPSIHLKEPLVFGYYEARLALRRLRSLWKKSFRTIGFK
jgi:hypothetical protein